MPTSGIWQHTRKMNSVMAVHSNFSRKGTFRTGDWICGTNASSGLHICKKRILGMEGSCG